MYYWTLIINYSDSEKARYLAFYHEDKQLTVYQVNIMLEKNPEG